MIKKTIILLIFLTLVPFCYAQNSDLFSREYLVLDTRIYSTLYLTGIGPDEYIESVSANISFFPKETENQQILESVFNPEPIGQGETAAFLWEKPKISKLDFEVRSRIKIDTQKTRVTKKVDFPIEDLESELKSYTKPREIIDTNEQIKEQASMLAEGEDDLYVVVHNVALWVNQNVEYNLSTANVKASKKATWVLENGEGVCDEITSLFISLVRSLGIPARFVSGISFTDSPQFEDSWGPHGWAEVYFPDIGWVPFDVTYDEFGSVDPTHIISKISYDAGESTSQYIWRGRDIKLTSEELDMEVSVKEKGPLSSPKMTINSEIIKENAGFGSYNIVKAEVQNLEEYYQSATIRISETTHLETVSDTKKILVLGPLEKKELYWIVKVDEDLKKNYLYMFPVTIYSVGDESSNTSFASAEDAPVFSFEEINNTVSVFEEEVAKTYSRKLILICEADKEEYYDYEDPIIRCDMKNAGNVLLQNLEICLIDDCKDLNLTISEEKEIDFTIYFPTVGFNDLIVTARNKHVSKNSPVKFDVLDAPKINISEIIVPESVNYNEVFNVSFALEKTSLSNPLDLVVEFGREGSKRRFEIEELPQSQKIVVEMFGRGLNVGENAFYIEAVYKDKRYREYRSEGEFYITLEDVNWWQKIAIFFKNIVRKVVMFFS